MYIRVCLNFNRQINIGYKWIIKIVLGKLNTQEIRNAIKIILHSVGILVEQNDSPDNCTGLSDLS